MLLNNLTTHILFTTSDEVVFLLCLKIFIETFSPILERFM
nr:MAG TPA: hypothetical protein [Bacteriophage sp.]